MNEMEKTCYSVEVFINVGVNFRIFQNVQKWYPLPPTWAQGNFFQPMMGLGVNKHERRLALFAIAHLPLFLILSLNQRNDGKHFSNTKNELLGIERQILGKTKYPRSHFLMTFTLEGRVLCKKYEKTRKEVKIVLSVLRKSCT